jgi:hypothetical protein
MQKALSALQQRQRKNLAATGSLGFHSRNKHRLSVFHASTAGARAASVAFELLKILSERDSVF